MKTLLDFNWAGIFRNVLNLGGTFLIVVGIFMLPIDIAYRLILEGCFALLLWKTLS